MRTTRGAVFVCKNGNWMKLYPWLQYPAESNNTMCRLALLVKDIFICKGYLWNVNCARQNNSFSTPEQMFLSKCRSVWDRKCLNPGRLEPPNKMLLFRIVINNHCIKRHDNNIEAYPWRIKEETYITNKYCNRQCYIPIEHTYNMQ